MAKPKADLARFFAPRGVALVGVSEDQSRYGGRVLRYCLDGGFRGRLYPVNPKYAEVFGITCYRDLAAIDGPCDVAVALVSAERLPALYDTAAAKGIGTIIVVGELAPAGARDAEERLTDFRAKIARGGPRLVGPMCMGALAPHARLCMSGSSTLPMGLPAAGPVGFVSQSGGIMSGVIDRARSSGAGFSGMVSSGGEFDLDTCDFVEFYIEDKATRAIAVYAEGLDDYPRFFALAERAREAGKPIVLLKPGFTAAGQDAALSHTGRIAGDRTIQQSAFRRHAIVMATDIDDLHATAQLLSGKRPDPEKGVGAATLSGGYAVVVGDALSDAGLAVAPLTDATKRRLTDEVVQQKPSNPADIGSRPTPGKELDDLVNGLQILHDDPNVGALYYAEMAFLGMDRAAKPLADFARRASKPLVVCWQGGPYVAAIHQGLREGGLLAFDTPAVALRALKSLYDYAAMSRRKPPAEPAPSFCLGRLRASSPGLMAEPDALALLADYGVTLAPWRIAPRAQDAGAAARALGFPVAIKGLLAGVAHKTERGLVALGLDDETDVIAAAGGMAAREPLLAGFLVQKMAEKGVEMLVGVAVDPHVGPAVALGFGGIYAEAMGRPVVEVAPLDEALALAMIAQLDRKNVLNGYRTGMKCDRGALARLLVAVSHMAHEQRGRLADLDLNPVIVSAGGAVAVDALIRLA